MAHRMLCTMQTTRWFVLLTLVGKLFASRNEMARDYFVYKNVPSVVAFLCSQSDASNNLHLTKILNQEGISAVVLYPELEFSLETVLSLKSSRSGVVLDLLCANWYSEFILKESSKFGIYNESYNWLLFGKSLHKSIRLLNDDTFTISTDLVIATPASSDVYDLHDVYNHGKDTAGKLNVTRFGTWHKKTGLNVTLVQEKYQRRCNFHGMKLKVISVTQYRPRNVKVEDHLRDYNKRPLDTMAKFAYEILLHMGEMYNFTMEIVETNLWDQVAENGMHVGMIGMLHRHEADLGATPAVMTLERATLAKLIGPVWPFRSCFMFRSIPTELNDEFVRPFTLESWIITGAMIIICVMVLGLTLKLEFLKDKLDAWNDSLIVTIGIMCQQGSTLTPEYLSSRIVIIQLLFFSLLTYNYYSASVVSAQLNLPLDKMNDSLHQLTQSHLKVAAEPITYTHFGLTSLNDWEIKEFYAKRWKSLPPETRYIPLEEGFARVAKGGFAYHTDPNTAYPYLERFFSDQMICELTEVHLFKPQKMALWGRRNGPLTKISKTGLTKLSNTGILNRQIKRWSSRKPVCFREAFIVQSVSMLTTAPAFIILCVGIFLASSMCILENVIARSHKFYWILSIV